MIDFNSIGIWGNAVLALAHLICAIPIMKALEKRAATLPHHKIGMHSGVLKGMSIVIPAIWLITGFKLVTEGGMAIDNTSSWVSVGVGSLWFSSMYLRILFDGGALVKPDANKLDELRALNVTELKPIRNYRIASGLALALPALIVIWGGILLVFAAIANWPA